LTKNKFEWITYQESRTLLLPTERSIDDESESSLLVDKSMAELDFMVEGVTIEQDSN